MSSFNLIADNQKIIAGKLAIFLCSAFIQVLFNTQATEAQSLDVAYVPTPYHIVEQMIDVANAGPGDYLIDLGSGDGRIVIAAAKRGAYGHGVDLDQKRIKEAVENAKKAGVSDRVIFIEENLYETDFSMATVITMYLFPDINIKLRPVLLEKLRPGTRVVSHDFSMDEWKADKQITLGNHKIYMWVIPAKVNGNWMWRVGNKNFIMTVRQDFQKIDVTLKSKNISLPVNNIYFSGDIISFSAFNPVNGLRYLYNGRVNGNNISGIIQIRNLGNTSVEKWEALLE